MILSTLELENYRQYRSERIEFPERGIVGVIGANGVGKTTLFEAIEWCLFAPRTIGNSDVPPRGIPGATKVTLTLFDPRDGASWVIERGLTKSGLKTAEIYRADNPAAPVVQGTGPVTRYIENRLIGLSHQAFVSTFFTRQKELSFFGAFGPSDRRREVSRLLGFDVIRAAQTEIADEGNARKGHADALAHDVKRTLDERDFEREIIDARLEAGRLGGDRDSALLALEQGRNAQAEIERERERLLTLQSRDGVLRVRLERVNGGIALADQRRLTAEAALVDLARKADDRQALIPIADGEPAARQTVERFEADRQRAEARVRMQRDIERQREEIARSTAGLQAAVAKADAGSRIPGWTWTDADATDPAAGAARLETLIAGLDVHGAVRRSVTLARCRKAADDLAAEQQRLGRYESKLVEYENQRDELFRDGDPADQAADARTASQTARERATAAKAAAVNAKRERERLQALIGQLRDLAIESYCPTCTRPISSEDAEIVIVALATQAEAADVAEAAEGRTMRAATEEAAAADAAEAEARRRLADVQKTDAALADGRQYVAEQTERVRQLCAERDDALRTTGLPEAPDAAEVRAAQVEADLLQAVAGAAATIAHHGATARRAGAEIVRLRDEIAALGPVEYDRAAHAAANDAWQRARDARSRITAIDVELEQGPQRETDRAAALDALERSRDERAAVERDLAEVGFDPAKLADAERRLAEGQATGEAATRSLHDAEKALDRALDRETRLVAEQSAFAERQAQAIVVRREADDLLRMRDEFNTFERFVAEQLGPRIADYAGELIDRVTNQKYSRVELDQDYGLEIYDGDECFPLSSFSGGERDVFALCARLALSRVIGGQAVNRPRFLVLDEVFGSLDQERRRQLLDMLGRLTQDSEDFRQLFVISHVEDVQESPAMSELWRVIDVEGHSHVETRSREATRDLTLVAGD